MGVFFNWSNLGIYRFLHWYEKQCIHSYSEIQFTAYIHVFSRMWNEITMWMHSTMLPRPSLHFYTHIWHYQVMHGLFRSASTSSNKLPSYYLALTAGNSDISAAIHESCKKCLRLSCTIDSDCYWAQLELFKPLKKIITIASWECWSPGE